MNTTTDASLIVMYHYVRPRDAEPLAGIRPLWLDEFEAQLDWLQRHFAVLSPADYLAWWRGELDTARPACLLTFDDGTQDQATISTPALAARGLSALFLVLSGPLADRVAPVTHKAHYLLSVLDDETLWAQLWEAAAAFWPDAPPEGLFGSADEAAATYYYEPPLRARIKYALNVRLAADQAASLLARVMAEMGIGEEAIVARWFASPADARRMVEAGMTLGVHGRSHRLLAALAPDDLLAEIAHCHETLLDVTGVAPRWYGPPFGGHHASATLRAIEADLRARGYQAVVTWSPEQRGVNLRLPGTFLRLERLDCVALPPRHDPPPEVLRLLEGVGC